MSVSLTAIHSMGTLLRSYKWDISIIKIPTMMNSVPNVSDQLNMRCIVASPPKATFEEVSASPRGIKIVEPGLVHLHGTTTFTLVETTNMITRKMLYDLRQICMEDEYKVQQDIVPSMGGNQAMEILMKRMDNHNNYVWQYHLFKCFLSDYTDPDFDSSSGAVQPTATFTYNYFKDTSYTF